MELKQKYHFARLLLAVSLILCLAWVVSSLIGFFDHPWETTTAVRILDALGPLGILGMVFGLNLCDGSLSAMKKRVDGAEE